MAKLTESELDQAIEHEFKNSASFTQWFLKKTKFKDEDAAYLWSRSDNPWGNVQIEVFNPKTGNPELISKESETDILVVFQTPKGKRFALHIENKISSGKFTHLQPELYGARARQWAGNEKYGNYLDWETVLIAPKHFYDRYPADSSKFDRFVSHEDIAVQIPAVKG